MKNRTFIYFILFISISIGTHAQYDTAQYMQSGMILDSLRKSGLILNEPPEIPQIIFSTEKAIEYLQQKYHPGNWKDSGDSLRSAIGRLLDEVSKPPYDSSETFLRNYCYDSINIPWEKFYVWEPVKISIPVSASTAAADTIPSSDTLDIEGRADTLAINIQGPLPVSVLTDTSILVIRDTLLRVIPESPSFPFRSCSYPFEGDSIRVAIKTLMDYVAARDSGIVHITGLGNAVTHIWLNSRADIMKRYWLKNEMGDSITVWIGTPSRNTIGLYLEQGVNFRRPVKQGYYSDARIEVREVDKTTLLEVKDITVKSRFWKLRSEASFALNQGAVSNWVKGGESSVAVSTDITGYADYTNKEKRLSSNNFARIKFGLLKSGENDIRKNLDLLETNSKLNHKAFGKFDISGVLLFKTQIAEGYNYTKTDTVLVSKFFNPAILTAGVGLDYKPNKTTSINFSPLSYKATFVTDTTGIKGVDAIDQTKYGIAADRLSKHEPGLSFMITNEFKPVKNVSITNRLQLFTNYINNPQNIDIDWEMILTASLNWFTDVRFNTHLIFDDDTKTPLFDKDKQPVLDPLTGKQKSTARIQFKELLGFSFIFRF